MGVGLAVYRWSGDGDLEALAQRPGNTVTAGAWLYPQVQQQRVVAPVMPASLCWFAVCHQIGPGINQRSAGGQRQRLTNVDDGRDQQHLDQLQPYEHHHG